MATRRSRSTEKTRGARAPRGARKGGNGGAASVVIPADAAAPRDHHALTRKEREARCTELRGIIAARHAEARDGDTPDKVKRIREIAHLRSFTYDAEFHALLAALETEHGVERTADDVAAAIAPEVELQQLEGIPADHDPAPRRQ